MIYADHAATHPLRAAAWEAMTAARHLWGNPSSLHAAGRDAREALEAARAEIARLLGARPREILFTSGGSESNTTAIRSAALRGAEAGKRHILTTAVEHPSVLNTLAALETEGFTVERLPVTPRGFVSADRVAAAIRPDTALVTVMHGNNEIGTVQPIREIAAVCRRQGVYCHTDGVQTVGRIPVDAAELGVDSLSFSAHKFGGPRGIGGLYLRRETPLTPLIPGGHQEGGRRAGTENLMGALAMAAALTEAAESMAADNLRLCGLSAGLVAEILERVPRVTVNGYPSGAGTDTLPHVISLSFEGIDGEALVYRLDAEGICVSAGSACTAGSPDPSHVITALGVPPETALGTIRISMGEGNTDGDVTRMAETIARLVADLRSV